MTQKETAGRGRRLGEFKRQGRGRSRNEGEWGGRGGESSDDGRMCPKCTYVCVDI